MTAKKASIKFFLGKIRAYLDAEQDVKKKSKRYCEAEKALTRLEKLFAGEVGKLSLKACRNDSHVMGG